MISNYGITKDCFRSQLAGGYSIASCNNILICRIFLYSAVFVTNKHTIFGIVNLFSNRFWYVQ